VLTYLRLAFIPAWAVYKSKTAKYHLHLGFKLLVKICPAKHFCRLKACKDAMQSFRTFRLDDVL
jgi:hypothetical protein